MICRVKQGRFRSLGSRRNVVHKRAGSTGIRQLQATKPNENEVEKVRFKTYFLLINGLIKYLFILQNIPQVMLILFTQFGQFERSIDLYFRSIKHSDNMVPYSVRSTQLTAK
jgi:hypothetical protein